MVHSLPASFSNATAPLIYLCARRLSVDAKRSVSLNARRRAADACLAHETRLRAFRNEWRSTICGVWLGRIPSPSTNSCSIQPRCKRFVDSHMKRGTGCRSDRRGKWGGEVEPPGATPAAFFAMLISRQEGQTTGSSLHTIQYCSQPLQNEPGFIERHERVETRAGRIRKSVGWTSEFVGMALSFRVS